MRRFCCCCFAGLGLAACTPVLDWREVRPEGGRLVALLPCKPEARVRQVALGGTPVGMQMLSCSAAGTVWALVSADVGDAARVEPALAALRTARAASLDGRETEARPIELAGAAKPALRFTVQGRHPQGDELREHTLQFAQGTRLYQVAALGGAPSAEALETLFGSLKLQP